MTSSPITSWQIEDEMVGWHHQLDGCEFEWTLGVGDGQGGWCAAIHGVAKSWTRLSNWTELLEKTLESPLDSKEIKPVNPKGNQSEIFIGKTDAEAEAPILWPPDEKSQLIRKDPDAGKDWRQEEKGMTESETVGWYHWLNGCDFEQALQDGEGQGSLACWSPWGCEESDTTEQLNNNNNIYIYIYIYSYIHTHMYTHTHTHIYIYNLASLVAQMVKNLPAMQDTRIWSLGWEDLLEKGMAAHSNILARGIPWSEKPGGL